MAVLTSLARLTALGRNHNAALRFLAGPPIELITEDGAYLLTADGRYIGVPA